MNHERKRHRLLDDLFGSETEDEEDEIDSLDDFDLNSEEEEIPKPKIQRRPNKDQRHAEGNEKLMKDYLLDNSTYDDRDFVRRFQLRKELFLKIVRDVGSACPYFVQKPDCTGKLAKNTFEGPIAKT
ncbi:hypothetical protein PTTG_05802 [Puccinia triticina 1-1 BBBD Race 1]|uniref:Uncharacterized protein n=1 Tax=Puccinia triticina (isolate 1-1 / race 1 (BBBD)) TaxID=630390 RepID=A0A180H1M0_PUCT1|nr:hypothetical protein PTTG_05802 [Puccinia triticina 1-1 BBBD Race 1]